MAHGNGHDHGHGDDDHHGVGLGKPLVWAGIIMCGFLGFAWYLTSAGAAARASGKHHSSVTLRNTATTALKLPTFSDRGSNAHHRVGTHTRLTGAALDRFNFVATYHRRMRPRYGLSATAAGPRRDIFRVVFAKKPSHAVLDLVTSGSRELRREAATRGFKHFQVIVERKVVFQKKL